MNHPIKILIAEHDRHDIELIQNELKKGGVNYTAEIVQTEERYRRALEIFIPDIIFSDYTFPSFDGPTAFRIKEKMAPDTPFILISGTIGEENSIDLIKNGVTDFVLKDKIFTLNIKLTRALEQAEEIKQKRIAQVLLIQSEARLVEAQALSKIGSWETELADMSVVWSRETYRIFEMQPGTFELTHKRFLEFIHPEDIGKVNKAFDSSFSNQTVNTVEHRIITGSGSIKNVEERWRILRDDKGNPIRAIGTCQDITESKKNELLIKASEEHFRTLFEQNLAGFYQSGKNGIIINCNKAFATMLGYGSPEELINTNAKELYFSVSDRNNFIENIIKNKKLRNHESVLKRKDGTPLYFLENIIEHKNLLTGEEYFDGILIDITERKKSEQEIGWLVNNTEESFILLNRALEITSFNDRAKDLYVKYFDAELIKGRSIMDYAPPERHQALKETYKNVLAGSEENSEIQIPQPGPSFINFAIKYKPAKNERGNIIGVFISAIDITEKSRAEKQKEFERRDKEALINTTSDLIWSVGSDFRLVAANRAFLDSLKNSAGVILKPGDNIILEKTFPVEFLSLWKQLYGRALTGESFNEEIYTPASDNYREAWAETRFDPIYDGDQITGIACYSRNITSAKRAQNNLLEINKKLEAAQQIAKMGYWERDMKSDSLYWSDEVYKIWGVSPDDYQPDFIKFYDSIHPADRIKFDEAQKATFAREANLDLEHRIILPDGSLKYVHEKGALLFDETNNILCFEGTVQDITERKDAEFEMRALTNRLVMATRSASLGIWEWDFKSDRLSWDEGMHSLYQSRHPETDLLHKDWIAELHPDDAVRVDADMKAAISDNTELETEFRIIWNDSTTKYIRATGIVERNAAGRPIRMIGTSCDITVQKENEQQLKLLESVITNTTDSVLITKAEPFDEPGPEIVYVNPAFTLMTGFLPEEVIGKTPRILQGIGSDNKELARMKESMRKWKPCEVTTLNYKKSGEEFWINFSISPVANAEGWFTHWIAIERDITERKLSEIRLIELNKSLEAQAKELALSNAELEQFAYVASHDLQEPLRMITSFLEILEKKYGGIIDDRGKKYIAFAVDGAKRMRLIILDLLEFSRVGGGEEILEVVNLNSLLQEIRVIFKKEIGDHNPFIYSKSLPLIRAYKTPLLRVFQNLVSNALKYRRKDIAPQIHFTVEELKDHWQFSVADNGIGISKEYFDKIFVLFQRLHNKDEYSGTGIGLAITKKIIEYHGGKIWLESEEGKGTTFYFTLLKQS